MGRIYNNRTITAEEMLRLISPILLCAGRPDFDRAIADADYQTVSLNLPLARSLAGMSAIDIRSVLSDRIHEILPQSKPVYLTDYEMLFDPRYGLDVLRLFVDLSRRRKLIVKWRGAAEGDALAYSEPGYEDYRRIRIDDYDVTVVK